MIGQNNPDLLALRRSRGKTLVDLSIELGYSPSFLNQLERGLVPITNEVARVLTNYYKVPINTTWIPQKKAIDRLENAKEDLEKQIEENYETIDFLENAVIKLYNMNLAYRSLMEKLFINSNKVKDRADQIANDNDIGSIIDYLIDHQLLSSEETK